MSDLDDIIFAFPPLPVAFQGEIDEVLSETESPYVNADGVPGTRRIVARKTGATFESIAALAPNVDVLWAGSLIQGSSLRSGTLAPINAPRTPLKLNIVVSDKVFEGGEVAQPSAGAVLSHVSQTIQSIIDKPVPARTAYSWKNSFVLEDALLRVGIAADWLSGSARADLTSSSSRRASRAVLKLVTAYFDVFADPPTSPASFVAVSPGVANDLKYYMGPDNPPCYVASVTYGRMVIATFASTISEQDYALALQAAFSVMLTSGSAGLDDRQKKLLQDSEVKVLVLGGLAGPVVERIQSDIKLDRIADLLTAGANYNLGDPLVPISYQIRYMSTSVAARISFVSNYDVVTESFPLYAKGLTITLHGLHFHDVADDDEDLSFGYVVEVLKADDSVLDRISGERSNVYVEEPGKVGGWRDNVNKFFAGEKLRCADPIFKVRVHVWVRTEDSDGANWKPTTQDVKPYLGDVQVSGGGGGRYTLGLTLSGP